MTQTQKEPESADILEFIPPKTTSSGPKGEDWLRSLPDGCFFISKAKTSLSAFFDRWGIAAIIPEAVMLAAPHRNNPLAYEFFWVDSQKFSEQNKLIAVLPEPDKEAGENNG